ncbi:neuronal acetylcholine receptor subunit beta-4-like [Glandiceps talaboti]
MEAMQLKQKANEKQLKQNAIFLDRNRCVASDDEEKLYSRLLNNYNPLIRPVESATDTLNVTFGLSISQLIDVDEKNQIMTASMWVKQRWFDYQLVWDPSEYDGLGVLHVPAKMLWMPDIVLYNNADGPYDVTMMNMALVYNDGTVFWVPPAIYKSSCQIDVSYFPFDEQHCKMKFGSWSHDGDHLDMEAMSANIEQEDYWENGEWEIVEAPVERHAIRYPCCEEVYVDLTFTLILHRKPLFYIVTLVLPCFLISILTVFVFYIPSDSGEKITLCISVLLALIVFLLLVSEIIPPTSKTIPLIGKYLLFTMILVSVSIVITVIVLNIHHRTASTHTMPSWVRVLFIECLPGILYMQRPGKVSRTKGVLREIFIKPRPVNITGCCEPLIIPRTTTNGVVGHQPIPVLLAKMSQEKITPSLREEIEWREKRTKDDREEIKDSENSLLPEVLLEAVGNINFIVNHLKQQDEEDEVSNDWKFVAMVIDRIFLWIFVIVCITGTCSILLASPVIWEKGDEHERYLPIQPVQLQ